ncbi:P-type conjugative transfer protein TrbG, partial [Xanthomonas citri pv. citri]|nr:P-type conjugative transfer protein TrbG [Xanthomonas citri pv. citri]
MKPSFRKAGNPAFRTSTLAILLCTSALAGCATANRPPEISYDNAVPAALSADPPAPVRVVEIPRPLPLPGQLQPVEPA